MIITAPERLPGPRYAGRSKGTPKSARRPPKPGEMVSHAVFKNLNWALDDDTAAAVEPGLVMKMEVVVRFVDVAEYADGRRAWMTSVLEVGRVHD